MAGILWCRYFQVYVNSTLSDGCGVIDLFGDVPLLVLSCNRCRCGQNCGDLALSNATGEHKK